MSGRISFISGLSFARGVNRAGKSWGFERKFRCALYAGHPSLRIKMAGTSADSERPKAKLCHVRWWPSSRVALLIEELGIHDKIEIQQISEDKLKSDEALSKVNPTGRVPCMDLGDGLVGITESGAIMELLLEMYDKDHKMWIPAVTSSDPPQSIRRRGQFLQFLHFGPATAHQLVVPIFSKTFEVAPENHNQEELAPLINKWNDVYVPIVVKQLEDSGGPYLMGEQYTAADVCASYDLMMASFTGVPTLLENPKVKQYFELISSRDAYKKFFTP